MVTDQRDCKIGKTECPKAVGLAAKLCSYAEVVMGQSPAGSSCNGLGEGMPLLNGPTEFGPHHPEPAQWTTDPKKLARAGDLLFCVRGSTTGRMNWADREYAIGRGVAAIRHRSGSSCQPLVRALIEMALADLLLTATGSTFPNVNRDQIEAMPVPYLEKSDQLRVAEILGSLDDKIELNRRMNRTLEELARAVFKAWFVDFLPVMAKQDGAKSFPGMDADTFTLFPDSFEDSPFGPIPRGWRPGRVRDVALVNAHSMKPSDAVETIQYIEISAVSNGEIFERVEYARGAEPSRARRKLQHGDSVLSTVRPDRRSYFLALNPAPNDICSTGFATVTPSTVPWSFLHLALTQDAVFEQLGRVAIGAAYPAVRPEVIETLPLIQPDDPISKAFQRRTAQLLELCESNRRESRTIGAIRDSLLPQLLNGRQ